MKHRRMIVFIYLLLSVAAYVLFAHWMWDGGTLGMLDRLRQACCCFSIICLRQAS